MTEYKISPCAYTKMIFHAAKYPHCAVNGILLAEKESVNKKCIQIIDAIPLFHQCLYVSPMVEIALIQIEAMANEKNQQIIGYYAAPENFYESSIDKVPGLKIADKIVENSPNSCLIVIENKLVTLSNEKIAIKVYNSTENRWNKAIFHLNESESTLEAVSALLKRGAMKDIVDFDNHLDNPECNWTNESLNSCLTKIMAMYC